LPADELSFVPKIKDVFDHSEELTCAILKLLKTGRQFRIGPQCKAIMGRSEADKQPA